MATKKKNAPHPPGQRAIHTTLPQDVYDELHRYTEISGLVIRREVCFAVRHWTAMLSSERQRQRERLGSGREGKQAEFHSRLTLPLYTELQRYTQEYGLDQRRELNFAVRHWLGLSPKERQKLREKIGAADLDESAT